MLRSEDTEGIGEGVLEGGERAGLEGAQALFHLRPTFLDGVEVRRVGRQKEKRCPGLMDSFGNTVHFMRAEVVHDHDLIGQQLRTQNLIEVGEKDVSVGRRFNRHSGNPTGSTDGAEYRHRSPVASWNAFLKSGTAHRTPVALRHFSGDAAFVEEDEPCRVDLPGFFLPAPALLPDPLGVLLGGVERLFFKRSPIFFKTSHSRPILRLVF